jgi:hypothetical protein
LYGCAVPAGRHSHLPQRPQLPPPALGPLFMEANMGRGILLWLLGVPIPIIILLWLFFGR